MIESGKISQKGCHDSYEYRLLVVFGVTRTCEYEIMLSYIFLYSLNVFELIITPVYMIKYLGKIFHHMILRYHIIKYLLLY